MLNVFVIFSLESLFETLNDSLYLVTDWLLRVLEENQIDLVDLHVCRRCALILLITFEGRVEQLGRHRLALGFQLIDIVVLSLKKPSEGCFFSTTSGYTAGRERDRVDRSVCPLEVSSELRVDFKHVVLDGWVR